MIKTWSPSIQAAIFFLRIFNLLLMVAHVYFAVAFITLTKEFDLYNSSLQMIGVIFLPSFLFQVSSRFRASWIFHFFAHGVSSIVIAIAIVLVLIMRQFPQTELDDYSFFLLGVIFGPGAIISINLLILLSLTQPSLRRTYFINQDVQMYQTMLAI
ncbi:unnamed protein product [Moneuplotes crassus]|uniref:Uncharacterized protein n=1 Tax=Euplotes crassus TaxID=5936 RepID=A0AAD2D708_EUPCR|nr:unnamed protein product [Moneuplotes crassus]